MLANVVDIVLGFGWEMVTYGARPVAEWFDVVQWSRRGGAGAGEDFTPGTLVGLFLSGLAAIVISIVMRRGRVFSRINAWARSPASRSSRWILRQRG